MIGLDVTARAMARASANLRSEIMGPGGAATIGYKPVGSASVLRGVGDKLDENRSVLDFLPAAEHSRIKDGTSTWDAASKLNVAITDIGGKAIDMSPAHRLSIGEPIKLVRGTVLGSRGPMDPSDDPNYGRGTVIHLLDGANCAMLQTMVAAGTGPADSHYGLEGLVFEGNAQNQSASVPGGAVQWYGVFTGTFLKRLWIRNCRGPGLVIGGGAETSIANHGTDTFIQDVAVNRCVLDPGQFLVDTNQGLSGAERKGLLEIDHFYAQNPIAAYGNNPRDNLAHRVHDCIRLRHLVNVVVPRCHVEAGVRGVVVENTRVATFLQLSGAWIGGGPGGDQLATDEGLLVIGDGNYAVHSGPMAVLAGTPDTPKQARPVVKKAGFTATANSFPDMPYNTSGEAASGSYSSTKTTLTPDYLGTFRVNNSALAVKENTFARPGFFAGYDAGNVTEFGGFYTNTGQLHLGTNRNQGGSTKSFVSINSSGDTNDRITLSDPVQLAARTATTGYASRSMGWVGASAAAQYLFTKTPNGVDARIPIITEGAGSPVGSVTPISNRGRHFYYDTTNDHMWCSTGTGTPNWKQMTV